jgi:hypothetical protein
MMARIVPILFTAANLRGADSGSDGFNPPRVELHDSRLARA